MIAIHALGDSALLVEFENRISPSVHEHVLGFAKLVESTAIAGVLEDCIERTSNQQISAWIDGNT